MIKKLIDFLYFLIEIFLSKSFCLSKLYIKFHHNSVKREIEISGLLPSDKVLHIGCGSIPYTLIILSKELKSNLVGIDINPLSVKNANDYLKHNKLSDHIKIELGDGKNFNVKNFDAIILSYGINPINLVFKNVIESAKDNAKVIIRRFITESNIEFNSILKKYYYKRKRFLLTQESIFLINKSK